MPIEGLPASSQIPKQKTPGKSKKIFLILTIVFIISGLILSFLIWQFLSKGRLILPNPILLNISSQDKTKLLTKPNKDPKNSQIQEKQALLKKYTQAGNQITVSKGCNISPLVLNAIGETTLVLKNNDSVKHTLRFNQTNIYTLDPNSTKNMTIPFDKIPENYGYACDNTSPSGYLYLKPTSFLE